MVIQERQHSRQEKQRGIHPEIIELVGVDAAQACSQLSKKLGDWRPSATALMAYKPTKHDYIRPELADDKAHGAPHVSRVLIMAGTMVQLHKQEAAFTHRENPIPPHHEIAIYTAAAKHDTARVTDDNGDPFHAIRASIRILMDEQIKAGIPTDALSPTLYGITRHVTFDRRSPRLQEYEVIRGIIRSADMIDRARTKDQNPHAKLRPEMLEDTFARDPHLRLPLVGEALFLLDRQNRQAGEDPFASAFIAGLQLGLLKKS